MKSILSIFLFGSFALAETGVRGVIGDTNPTSASVVPEQIRDTGIVEKIGEKINLDLKFKDESGLEVNLQDYFHHSKPVILSMVYFSCANLCNFHLHGMAQVFHDYPHAAGEKYEYVAVSFDPKEGPKEALDKKEMLNKENPVPGSDSHWHFLTSSGENAKNLANQLGFTYKWNPELNEWAHGSAAFVLTDEGVVSRVLHGIEFKENTLGLSILEASKGKVGSFVDRAIMYCYHYDPKERKYSIQIFKIMQAGGGLMVMVLIALLGPTWLRRNKNKLQGDA